MMYFQIYSKLNFEMFYFQGENTKTWNGIQERLDSLLLKGAELSVEKCELEQDVLNRMKCSGTENIIPLTHRCIIMLIYESIISKFLINNGIYIMILMLLC